MFNVIPRNIILRYLNIPLNSCYTIQNIKMFHFIQVLLHYKINIWFYVLIGVLRMHKYLFSNENTTILLQNNIIKWLWSLSLFYCLKKDSVLSNIVIFVFHFMPMI